MTKQIKHINWKRLISAILCFVLLVGSLPLSVFAEALDTNESSTQQTPQINNLSSAQPSTDDIGLGDLLNTVPSDYPQNATDVLGVRLPQTVGVSTERPSSFANNTANLTYENGYTGTAASKFNSGTGTSTDPYIIKTGAQLKYFADQVNAGNTFSGKYIKLDANINLNGKNWTPIGYSRSFAGNFDGNYHEIKNMKITYSSGNALDSETYYIGFWGKVSNATIKNLGIADYTVNQTYSFHTVIGGFAAQIDASTVQNCYANGDITTNFGGLYYVGMTKTLNGQSNVYTVTNVADIPTNTDSISKPNILIDLSGVDAQEIGKTFTIGSNVSTVQFIGKAGATYSKFNIVIGSATTDINIIFENFSMSGDSSSGAIYSTADRQINIYTCGTENKVDSSVAAPALNVPSASTTIMGEAKITFIVSGHGAAGAYPGKAGNGKNGAAGNPGSSGSAGMIADSVLIYANDVVCVGGQGGAGSKGGQGNSSTFKTKKSGGRGGDGGTGGSGLVVNNLGIIRGAFSITGGKGGSGGQGGTPGALGTAGTGGTGGTGGTALVIAGSVYGIEPQLTAGAGGDKGSKGLAGGVSTGKDGSAGSAGAGGATSSPATYSVLAINNYTYSPIIIEAQLTIGGFVAIATGKTTISNSAVIIDSITTPLNYPNDKIIKYWFVAQNSIPSSSGKIDGVLTLKTNGQTYATYAEGDAFGGTGAHSASTATILTGYVDGQNVTYATGINTSGEYNDIIETIVIGKSGSKSDVVIPATVFAGRFIMPVVAIDNGAFWNNTSVKNVTLGKNVLTLGEAAFMGSYIESFNDFYNNVTIGNRAFANCMGLTVVDVSNAKDLGEVAFYGCTALGSTGKDAVKLGDNLTEIKKGVFYNCVKLLEIEIPKNVATIGISAFFGSGLRTVDYSKATALTTIKDSAFATSTSLVDATIPNTVQTVEPCAYYGCTAITTVSIGSNVKTIGEAAFYSCSALEGVIVPINVTTIGASVFGGCSKLKSITVPFVGSTKNEDDKTHFGYIFGAGTYKGNDDVVPATLTSVTVLSGAKKIDEYAFCWCANIKTVCLPDTITSIGKYAFCSCGLTEAVVPDSVDVIGFAAFENCKQIKQMTLPFVGADDDFDVVTDDKETQNIDTHLGYIFGAQFYQTNDSAIPDDLSVVVSNNATKIAENAFYGCNRMVSITLGENITIIGSKAFFDCNGISTISVPDSVTAIGKEAFGRSDTSQKGNLTTVTIGNGVEIIEEKILVGRSEVETINIGSSVKTFKDLELKNPLFGIDKNTSSLKKYDVSLDNTAYKTVDGVLYELFELKDINGVSSQYLTVAVVDVPSNVNISQYEPLEHVVRIYANAFSHNKTIESVKLDYIREIGDAAFFNATNLKTVEFGTPDEFFVGTNGNWFIKEYVYDEETNSTNIQERDTGIVASNTQRPYVGDDNYWYVGEVNVGIVNLFRILDEEYKIKIEQYSQNIGTNAFKGCSSLSNVNLESEYISKIGASAFAECATAKSATPLNIVLGRNITILAAGYEELYNKDKEGNNALRDFFSVFSGSNVASFDVVEGNSKFFAHDGVLYFKTGGVINEKEELWLIAYPSNKSMNLDVEKGTELPFEVPSFDTMIVTRVAKNSFNGAKYLKEVVIGNGVETVDDTVFVNTDIVSITFGDSVLYIGSSYDGTSHMFDDCNSLFYIKVDENNPKYSHVEGVLFNKDQTELIKYPQMKVGLEYSVPGTVSTVYGNAFAGNKNLRRVSFESPITYIGNRAFYGCSNLSMVYFKRGDAPFNRTELQKDKNGLFLTNNPTTTPIVCYGESTSNWDLLTDIYTNDEEVAIYAIEPFNGLASSEDVSNGYYAIVVLDNEGNPLNHVSVELGESVATIGKNSLSETVKTQAGIAMFLNPSYDVPYKLSVVDNNGQYFPYENTEFYLDKETRVTYIALSAVPTVSGVSVSYENTSEKVKDKLNSVLTSTSNILLAGVESGTFDINSETVKINKWLIDEITLKVNCGIDTNAEILGLKLFQGGDYIDEQYITINQSQPQTIGGKKFVTIEITIATEHLKQEEDVYVSVETSSGIVQTKLNVQIIEFAITDVDLSWISEGIDFDVDQDISALLKGVDKIDIITGQKYFPTVAIKVKNDTYEIAISISNGNENQDDKIGEELFGMFEKWEVFKSYFGGSILSEKNPVLDYSEKHSKFIHEFDVMGLVEIKYSEENSKPEIVAAGIQAGIELGYSWGQTFQAVVVPIRVEIKVSFEGTFTFKLEFDDSLANTLKTSNAEIELKLGLDVYGGIGCKLISVGVYGKGEIKVIIAVFPDFDTKQATLNGEIGLRVKYSGLFVKWKRILNFWHLKNR
ncbi:MAG: leucine-rich repeat protein [Clostridia bacterium]|nr:leucine-rich repeat protein [Clostridia bacterium]